MTYFGHSQGGTQFWVANCLHQDIGEKFEAFVGFAPELYNGHQRSVINTFLYKYGLDVILDNMGINEMYSNHGMYTKLGPRLL